MVQDDRQWTADDASEPLLDVHNATLVARGQLTTGYDGLFLWKLREILGTEDTILTVDLRRVRSMPGRFYSLLAEAGVMAKQRHKNLRILATGALAASLEYSGVAKIGSIELVLSAATRSSIQVQLPTAAEQN